MDIKTELKTIKALSKLLREANEKLKNPEDLIGKGVLDGANVCLVEGLTPEARSILSRFVEESEKENLKNTPEFKYDVAGSSKYSIEYLPLIMNFLSVCGDSISLSVCLDYPLTATNKHFKVVLAPRVSDE